MTEREWLDKQHEDLARIRCELEENQRQIDAAKQIAGRPLRISKYVTQELLDDFDVFEAEVAGRRDSVTDRSNHGRHDGIGSSGVGAVVESAASRHRNDHFHLRSRLHA